MKRVNLYFVVSLNLKHSPDTRYLTTVKEEENTVPIGLPRVSFKETDIYKATVFDDENIATEILSSIGQLYDKFNTRTIPSYYKIEKLWIPDEEAAKRLYRG